MSQHLLTKLKSLRVLKSFLLFCFVFILMLFSAGASKKKFIKIFFPNGASVTAELAVTDEERQRGLMFRKEIHSDQGMLFVFDNEDIHGFWMKNMNFSLDFLWLDKEKRIVHIERDVPPCKKEPCPTYSSKIPAMYVLELKAGFVEKNNLKLWDKIEFILPAKFK